MKRIVIAAMCTAVMLLCGFRCSAEGAEGFEVDKDELFDSLGLSGDDVYGRLTPEAEQILGENGMTLTGTDKMTEISPVEVLGYILEKFRENMTEPVRLVGMMLAAAALSAAVSQISDTVPEGRMNGIYEIISVLVTVSAVSVPISQCLGEITSAVGTGGNFMIGYIPVFAGIAASSGTVTGAALYDLTVEAAAEGAVQLSAHFIMPLLSVCMAVGIIDGINPHLSLGAVTSMINKIVSFVMITVLTIFSGMLTLQSRVGTATDTIGAKTAKLAVANFVPVIGGALSDTYSAVRSGLEMLKSAAGFFGIASVAVMILPPLVRAASLYFALSIGSSAAEILSQDRMSRFLKNSAAVVGMAMGMLLCFAALLIISTAVIMSENIV